MKAPATNWLHRRVGQHWLVSDAVALSTMKATILTLGGGGFSMSEDGSSLIDDFLINLTGRERPRVCFVPTASGDSDEYCEQFMAAFSHRTEASVLSLFSHDPWGFTDPTMLLEQDIIYVGGGSTANLLAVWRVHGLPQILARAAANGVILAGISAGMNCWFDASSTDSFGSLDALDDGLGFLQGSACPHYFGEEGRRQKYMDFVTSGALPPGHAADDHVALLWRDGELVEAVSEQEGRQAFTVNKDGESSLHVRYLGRRHGPVSG